MSGPIDLSNVSTNGVEVGAKRFVLEQKLVMWRNTQYSVSVDIVLADGIGDVEMKRKAEIQAKQAIISIDALEKAIVALNDKAGLPAHDVQTAPEKIAPS